MLTPRQNSTAILNREQPDSYCNFMPSMVLLPDPVNAMDASPDDGLEHPDSWGTVYIWLPGAPGAHPHVTEENAVVKDIEDWENQIKFPDIDDLDWSEMQAAEAEVDREEYFCGWLCATGLFERSHMLMGFEEALCAYLTNPDEMKAMLRAIADWKIKLIRLVAENVHPDAIFYHDDWGTKANLFLPPAVWRDIIKPLQREISDTIHDCGMLYVHHADCVCQPIVEDMVEIGIDIWQGVIPQNDIVEIQRITQGKLAMIGGVDAPSLDIEGISEEAIRAEVRRCIDTYCPAGRFFPAIPNTRIYRDWNNSIAMDELEKYGRQYALEHPVG